MEKIRLGISACLLGQKVRYDGGHKLDCLLTDTLGQYVRYIPVCPEVEAGFSIPREPFRLIGPPKNPRLVTIRTSQDQTARMLQWARKRTKELGKEGLCGYIFKSGSPSCGIEGVKVYGQNGVPAKVGVGIFARVFMEHFPLLPVEDEGRLSDPFLRENFIERIFTLKRWRETLLQRQNLGNLINFHTRHKLLILSHSPEYYRTIGKVVAQGKDIPPKTLYDKYQTLLKEALRRKATTKKNANVLQHMIGYFKEHISADDKQELLEIIEQFRLGYLPLLVPITLMNYYARKYNQLSLKGQYYLKPHPLELQLRNHV